MWHLRRPIITKLLYDIASKRKKDTKYNLYTHTDAGKPLNNKPSLFCFEIAPSYTRTAVKLKETIMKQNFCKFKLHAI